MKDEIYSVPPPFLDHLTLKHLIRYLGPGAVIASVTIGSGELVLASRGGAIFGYALLWCFVYSGVFKAVGVYAANRHMVLTGKHPIVSWRDLPGPPLWLPVLIALPPVILVPVVFSALPEILGGYMHILSGYPRDGFEFFIWEHYELRLNLWASLVLVFCFALAIFSSFDRVERISAVILGIMVLCICATVWILGPDITAIFKGMLIPQIPAYDEWITSDAAYGFISKRNPWLEVALYLNAVGGGTETYLGYTATLREKRWGLAGQPPPSREILEHATADSEQLRRAKLWSRAPLLDSALSFFLVILVTLLFAILGSEILHEQKLIPGEGNFLNYQEQYLTRLHPALAILYRLGVFLAFIGTLYGAFILFRYTVAWGLYGVFLNRVPEPDSPVWRKWVFLYGFIGGLFLIWLPSGIAGDVVGRLTVSSLLVGAFGCGLWCFAMLWCDRRQLPKGLQMKPAFRAILLLSGTVLFGLGSRAILSFVFGW